MNPISYVQQVRQEQYAKAEKVISLEELALTRAPNYVHSDGRIYASRKGQPYVAVSVSPYNDNLRSQIEDGVWPHIDALLNSGYLTQSSCEGHNISFSNFYIMVAFGNEQYANEFVDGIGTIEGMTIERKRSVANVKQVVGKQVKWQRQDSQEHTLHEEYKDLNRMYMRQYKEYWFVIVNLFAGKRGAQNVFWNIRNSFERKKYLATSKDLLLERIKELPFHNG